MDNKNTAYLKAKEQLEDELKRVTRQKIYLASLESKLILEDARQNFVKEVELKEGHILSIVEKQLEENELIREQRFSNMKNKFNKFISRIPRISITRKGKNND